MTMRSPSSLGARLHAFLKVGHNHVDPRGQRLGLAGAQSMGKTVNIRDFGAVPDKQRPGRQRTTAHHRRIVEIAKRFQVVGPFSRVRDGISDCHSDSPNPSRIVSIMA